MVVGLTPTPHPGLDRWWREQEEERIMQRLLALLQRIEDHLTKCEVKEFNTISELTKEIRRTLHEYGVDLL